MPWFLCIIVAVALDILAYLISPTPKQTQPAVEAITSPIVDAGVPITVVFGSITVTDPNILWYGDSSGVVQNVNA